jgi:short-subunit dehydrogenase
MHSSFQEKAVIITGSSRGLGKVLAIELGKRGAHVIINGKNSDTLQLAYHELKKLNYDVHAVCADVTKPDECEQLIQYAIQNLGKLDIVINNATLSARGFFEEMSSEVFNKVVQSNIQGAAFPTLKALPYLRKSKGSVVFVSSIAAFLGLPSASAYSIGKMGLTALAQSLKSELSGSGIHVGIAYVGFVRNDPEKTILNSKGEHIKPHNRPAYVEQSQLYVAHNILKMIERRKYQIILSMPGKFQAFMARIFPQLTMRLINLLHKRSDF